MTEVFITYKYEGRFSKKERELPSPPLIGCNITVLSVYIGWILGKQNCQLPVVEIKNHPDEIEEGKKTPIAYKV